MCLHDQPKPTKPASHSRAGYPHDLVPHLKVVFTHWTIFERALLCSISSSCDVKPVPSDSSVSVDRGSPSMTTSEAGNGPCGPAACISCSRIWSNPSRVSDSLLPGSLVLTLGHGVVSQVCSPRNSTPGPHPVLHQHRHQSTYLTRQFVKVEGERLSSPNHQELFR